MQYRQLGKSGVRVSVIGLGGNRLGMENKVPQEQVNRIIAAAQEHGINFIDTADVYTKGRSEETLGVALKGRWDRFVLATKFEIATGDGPNDHGASRYHLQNALEASLRRLQSDHIDLYYVHNWDATTPVDETLRALDDAVRAGKVRYIGASNFPAWQVSYANLMAELRGWSQFVVIQDEYNLFQRKIELEILPYCQAHKVGFIPYFPLAGGFLTGKYRRNEPPPSGSRGENSPYVQKFLQPAYFDKIERLSAWAAERGRSLPELAHAWLLAQPEVASVISGATKPEQIAENARGSDWNLTPEEAAAVTGMLDREEMRQA